MVFSWILLVQMKFLKRFIICRISGKIVQLETITQTEAMRRRYRYLSHFSLTTTFQVPMIHCTAFFIVNLFCSFFFQIIYILFLFQLCEIDMSEMLPPDALSPFMDEIKKRENQRKRLARKVHNLYVQSIYPPVCLFDSLVKQSLQYKLSSQSQNIDHFQGKVFV